ncbi:DUF192 domain-containing protein [Thalassorhabdomicrobium marinisediminis]|nr:DUF192 domain-containing protein [Thalassorhabdomicrobium marinisediminis]
MGNRSLAGMIVTSAVVSGLAGSASAACTEDELRIRGAFGEARFTVSVVDTVEERAQGLMFVEQMGRMEGMLFVYDRPQSVSFWMRNTLIPLDMVFIGADGIVSNIHSNAQPLDETPIYGGHAVQYVLEVNGGMADRLGLAAGDEVQHPSLGADAAWPCAEK